MLAALINTKAPPRNSRRVGDVKVDLLIAAHILDSTTRGVKKTVGKPALGLDREKVDGS
jgi:hypothetical protein